MVLDPSQHADENRGVLAAYKVPTTHNPTHGIEKALRIVLKQSKVPIQNISSVTIGTTAFLNSVIERDARHLSKVAVIRLSKSFLRDVRPFCDWPQTLADIIQGYVGYVDGGLHIDGSEEASIVEEQVVDVCQEIRRLGLTTIVVAGVYSPIDTKFQQEERVKDIVAREIPGADIVCSRDVANIGMHTTISGPPDDSLTGLSYCRLPRARKCLYPQRCHPQVRSSNHSEFSKCHEEARALILPTLPHTE